MKRDQNDRVRTQAALHRLMDGGHSLADIADLAGIDYQKLLNFSSTKLSIGAKEYRALKAWIEERESSRGDARGRAIAMPLPTANLDELVSIATGELSALVKAMESDALSAESKLRKLFAWVEVNHGDLMALRKSLQQGKH